MYRNLPLAMFFTAVVLLTACGNGSNSSEPTGQSEGEDTAAILREYEAAGLNLKELSRIAHSAAFNVKKDTAKQSALIQGINTSGFKGAFFVFILNLPSVSGHPPDCYAAALKQMSWPALPDEWGLDEWNALFKLCSPVIQAYDPDTFLPEATPEAKQAARELMKLVWPKLASSDTALKRSLEKLDGTALSHIVSAMLESFDFRVLVKATGPDEVLADPDVVLDSGANVVGYKNLQERVTAQLSGLPSNALDELGWNIPVEATGSALGAPVELRIEYTVETTGTYWEDSLSMTAYPGLRFGIAASIVATGEGQKWIARPEFVSLHQEFDYDMLRTNGTSAILSEIMKSAVQKLTAQLTQK